MVLNQPSYQAKPSFQHLDGHYVKDDFSDSTSCDALEGEEDQDWSLYIGVAAEEKKVLMFDLDTPAGGWQIVSALLLCTWALREIQTTISSTPEEFTKRKGIGPS
jgi:hypothetical protein